jgi:hypothetical protein
LGRGRDEEKEDVLGKEKKEADPCIIFSLCLEHPIH